MAVAGDVMRICRLCGTSRPLLTSFSRTNTKDGYFVRCKICCNRVARERYGPEQRRAWARSNYQRTKTEIVRKARERRHANREQYRDISRRYLYGLTRAQFDAMKAAQGNVCAICCLPQSHGKELCVDHCHTTGKIRGLLCRKCNAAIGLLGDDIAMVETALRYLRGDFERIKLWLERAT